MFTDPTFYVLVAFVLFFVFAGKPLSKAVLGILDSKINTIQSDLEISTQQRERSQATLTEAKLSYHHALTQIEEILEQAQGIALQWQSEAQQNLRFLVEKRREVHKTNITILKEQAFIEIREIIADTVINHLENKLKTNATINLSQVDKILSNHLKN